MIIRKITSGLVIVLVLLSGTHISLASHICGGSLAAVKWSFDGSLASCGMESDHLPLTNDPVVREDCCHDHLTRAGIDETISCDVQDISEFSTGSTVFHFSGDLFEVHFLIVSDCLFLNSGPPGIPRNSTVDLNRICISRC